MTSLKHGATGHLCGQPLFSRPAWRKAAPGASPERTAGPGAPLAKAGSAHGQPHAGMEAM